MTLWGDANCDGQTDMADVVLVLQAQSNPAQYGLNGSHPSHITAQGIENADVIAPLGDLTVSDALRIQKAPLGMIPNAPGLHTNNMVASGAEVGFSFVDGAGNRTVAVKPGQSTTFDVFVNISAGARPISAIDVNFACSSPIQISDISDSVTAFEGQLVSSNLEELRANYVALDNYGPVLPQDGKAAFKLSVTVPANTPEGVYTIGFGDNCMVFKDNTGAIYTTSVTPLAICVGAPYYDPVGGTNAVRKTYTAYTGQTMLNGGWYLLTGNITNDASIVVFENTHLILADGASLTVRNIAVYDGRSFTVWAQSDGANMGKLTATGGSGAGIGGRDNGSDITVTVNGGEVTATGGSSGYAGIGGGSNGTDVTVTVNGGKVTATGGNSGTGIGGGNSGSDITVTVNGGTVTATGSMEGAGIGGGSNGSGITVTINGGEVTAKGGEFGAGIGGAGSGTDVTVTIAGGEVKAQGYAGIGGGNLGSGVAVKINPVGGKMIDLEAGNNKYVAVPVAGSPFAKETDVTSLLAEKYFVRTRAVMGYLDPTDPANPVKTLDDYAYYAGETTLTSGWYVVTGDITNDTTITVNGDAHLILADGASLTANVGINVEVKNNVTNSLTIWAQSDGANMGRLTAEGGDAGIGGGWESTGVTVTVNGGKVTARGGDCGAGIGGGFQGSGVTVTINGGNVTAQGGLYAAGIGGGRLGTGVTVTINGGTVAAQGDGGGAGIGGGGSGSGVTVTINGGNVEATGGDAGGAGIGGGYNGSGVTVKVMPAGGIKLAVTAGADAGSAVAVAGSPFAAETDVTSLLAGKPFAHVGKAFEAGDIALTAYEGVYDGEGHTIGIATNAIKGLALRYSSSSSPMSPPSPSDTLPLFTNVCEVTVWVEARAPGYVTFTTNATVKITKAPLTITAKDQAYRYNGLQQGESDTIYATPEQIAEKVVVEGLKGGDRIYNIELDGEATQVGRYSDMIEARGAVIVSGGNVPVTGNYDINYEPGTLAILAEADVTDVAATPSEPWDGKVGLSFSVTNSPAVGLPDWNKPCLSIVATDNLTGSNYVAAASALTGDTDAADGAHAVEWDFDAQGLKFASSNVTFTVAYVYMPEWCVIDLSGGKDAVSYPVAYISDVADPATFNTDAYKTTNLVMHLIRPGTFEMGESGSTETTEITNAFYCAVFETTQRQWELVTGARPSKFKDDADSPMRPVEQVSWNMIRGNADTYDWPNVQGVDPESFVGVLRQKTGLNALDLPTEAQWEYACRAGTTTQYSYGDGVDGGYMWYEVNSTNQTHVVGIKPPNDWGFYDMHGNVWEWCLDFVWEKRVNRGGSWNFQASYCTSSFSYVSPPSLMSTSIGLRLVRTLSDDPAERTGTVCASTASEAIRVGKDFTADEIQLADYAGTYDGEGHTIGIATNAIPGLVLKYDGQDEPPLFTNVCDRTVSVEASAPGYFSFTTNATVTIAPAPLTITAKDQEFLYNGTIQGEGDTAYDDPDVIAGKVVVEGLKGTDTLASIILDGQGKDAATYPIEPSSALIANGSDIVTGNYAIDCVNGMLMIAQRTVTLTSGSASKVYDGTALTCAGIAVGGDGFLDGEGATYDVTGSQTHVGVGTNTFTYALNDGTSVANYAITTSNGTLTVTKAANAWTTDPSIAGWTYGEAAGVPNMGGATFGTATVTYSAMVGDAGDYTATFTVAGTWDYDGLTFEVPFTIARATFADGDIVLTDYAGTYDGEAHTIGIATNAIPGLVLRYSSSSSPSSPPSPSDTLPLFTDVTNVTVYVEASAPNYVPVTNSATVTIAPRMVTLTSGSAEKVYDGTALTCADVAVGGDGFVVGEGATYDVTGTQTHVGASENAFTYSLNDGTFAANYEITTANGTLTVEPCELTDDAVEVELALPEGGYVGDGTAKTPDISITCGGRLLVEGEDYDVLYTNNVEPGTATVTVTFKGDYTGTASATFTIAEPEPEPEPVAIPRLWDSAPSGAVPQYETSVYDGYLYQDAEIVGTVELKVGKPGRRTGLAPVRATVRLVSGEKLKFAAIGKNRVKVSGTGPTIVSFPGGAAFKVILGARAMSGTCAGYGVDGSLDVFRSKDAANRSAAASALGRIQGAENVAWPGEGGWNALSARISRKGRARVVGSLADGSRVSASGRLIVGGGVCCVPVVTSGKARLAFGLWLPSDGDPFASGLESAVVGAPAELESGAAFRIDRGGFAAALGWTPMPYLPDGVPVVEQGGRWTTPRAGKVVFMRGTSDVDPAQLGDNPSSLRIFRRTRDGMFSGSFRAYQMDGGRPKWRTVKVSGVAVGGRGYGTASVRKSGSAPVEVRADDL